MSVLPKYLVEKLVCPNSREPLVLEQKQLRLAKGEHYPILSGIPALRFPPLSAQESSQERPQVSLLIMTRNEEECISSAILKGREVLDDLELSYEVLVVDGNSTDATVEKAEECGARVIPQSRPGYSAAFQEGLQNCVGEYIVTIDADLSHDPNFIRSLWQARHSAEVVIGSRYVAYGGAQMPKDREYMSRLLNGFLRTLLSIPVRDLSSGLRLYHASAVQALRLEGHQFDVLIEVLARFCNEGYLTREVPFFYKPRIGGRTKVRLVQFAWAYLRATLRLFPLRHSQEAADHEFRVFQRLFGPGKKTRERRYEAIMTLLNGTTSDLALVGCGATRLAVSLPGAVCVDSNLSKLRFLRRTHSLLVHADAHALPFAEASFGSLVAGPHFTSPEQLARALEEFARVVRPGGRLVVVNDPSGHYTPPAEEFSLVQELSPSTGETVQEYRRR